MINEAFISKTPEHGQRLSRQDFVNCILIENKGLVDD